MSLVFKVVTLASDCSEVTLGVMAPAPRVEGAPERGPACGAPGCTILGRTHLWLPLGPQPRQRLPSRDTTCRCGVRVCSILLGQPRGTPPKATPNVGGCGRSPSHSPWAPPDALGPPQCPSKHRSLGGQADTWVPPPYLRAPKLPPAEGKERRNRLPWRFPLRVGQPFPSQAMTLRG